MTDVAIAPRMEAILSDTEAILSGYFVQVRPSKTYVSGGQWVLPIWPAPVPIVGASITAKLDPLPDVPYELKILGPDGAGQSMATLVHEFRIVPSSGVTVNWFDLTQVTGPGGDAVLTDVVDARLDALEAALGSVSGGATNLAGITDMSPFARTLNDDTSASAARTTLGAAQDTAVVHLSGTETITGTKTINTASVGTLTVTTAATAPTPTVGDNDTSIATTAFVQTAIAALGTIVSVPAVTGLTLRLTYRTTDVSAVRPTVPTGVSIDWEVPGDTEPTNIRWDLGDVWTSVYS